MKTLIVSILILCLTAVIFCGCGKKSDKDTTESQISMTEGVDEISVENIEENAVEIDFETGSVISNPSDMDSSTSSSSPSETLGTPSSSTSSASSSNASESSSSSGASSSDSSSSSSSSSSSDSSSDASGDESRETNSGFSPWQ